MIPVRCRTNLDEFHYSTGSWPEEFVCRPQVGDRVEYSDGRILKIVAITHQYNRKKGYGLPEGPYLEIELTKIV